MRYRFRPFGFDGSLAEVLVGVLICHSVIGTDEPLSPWFDAAVGALGTLVVGVGLVGLTFAAHAARSRRQASGVR